MLNDLFFEDKKEKESLDTHFLTYHRNIGDLMKGDDFTDLNDSLNFIVCNPHILIKNQ